MDTNNSWTLNQAIELCCDIEQIAKKHDYHIALTGGCLYKTGERKDLDILFYTVRQKEGDRFSLESDLTQVGIDVIKRYGWMSKAKFGSQHIDIFFPETSKNEKDSYIRDIEE